MLKTSQAPMCWSHWDIKKSSQIKVLIHKYYVHMLSTSEGQW